MRVMGTTGRNPRTMAPCGPRVMTSTTSSDGVTATCEGSAVVSGASVAGSAVTIDDSGVHSKDSNAAVDATRGLVLAYEGRYADALFVSTCGGITENVENVFGEDAVPYLVSVDCGERETASMEGARVGRGEKPRTALQWRGFVLRRLAGAAGRDSALSTAQKLAGVDHTAAPPAVLSPAAYTTSTAGCWAHRRTISPPP